jgi:hypothetical protein
MKLLLFAGAFLFFEEGEIYFPVFSVFFKKLMF